MELLECGYATNDKREHCEVCEQRFNELEYGVLKYKDMGPYGLGAWVLIYGCIYGMGHHMDMGVWVLIYGCISHAEDKPISHAAGHLEVDSDSVAYSAHGTSRYMHYGLE